MMIHLADPLLPFVLLHNEVHIRPRSYVRIPIRFVPVSCSVFECDLIVQTASGSHVVQLKLRGRASILLD